MFDRYTERARRVIFLARAEAGRVGSPSIETEHLLLGLLHEDKTLADLFSKSNASLETLREQIESRAIVREKVSNSIDLPLSLEFKEVLADAAGEADGLQHNSIDCGHLSLALLRLENGFLAELLRRHGIDYISYREIVRIANLAQSTSRFSFGRPASRMVDRPSAWEHPEQAGPAASSLRCDISALQNLVDGAMAHLNTCSDGYGEQHLKRKSWSRKEALGHLIDLASAHHQWLARALTETRLTAIEYPQERWISAQQYRNFAWRDLVDLWVGLNRLVVHVLMLIPERKVETPCRIGIEQPITLLNLIHQYVERSEDLIGQIVARLN